MKKPDSFIEDRIRWRASQHKIDASTTMFWEDAPSEYKEHISEELGIPVILSAENSENYTVVCTRGAYCIADANVFTFMHSQIKDFNGKLTKEPFNYENDYLIVSLENNDEVAVKTEKGETLPMVWNILLMLQRMS